MLTPKELFLQDERKCKALTALLKSDLFEEALVYTLADVASSNPTAEQMRGINYFVDRLVNFPDKEKETENTIAAPRLTPPELLVPDKGKK